MLNTILTEEKIYELKNQKFKAYIAYPNNITANTKAILIAHDWSGRNEFFCEKAKELASLGYIGFAADLYGDAKVGNTIEEKQALHSPLVNDRSLLLKRMQKSLEVLKNLPLVNPQKTAAIGYCFGGLCVLDLARSGANIQGIVSFHGILAAPENMSCAKIQAKILVLHGYKDPMVQPLALAAFEKEMAQKNVDWQVHVYGQAEHAFTNPKANNPELGLLYNEAAKTRSWQNALWFLESL